MPKNEIVKLIVDMREHALCEELKGLQDESRILELECRQLEVGDVIAGESTIIERKTRTDFENSIIDNRLFTQLTEMQKYANRVLVVEGTEEYRRLHRNAILGCYGAVVTKFSTSIMFTRDLGSTAELVYYIAKHAQEDKDILKLVAEKRTTSSTDSSKIRRIVESFPMVGPVNAKSLLEEFGTLRRILSATRKELLSANHMGETKADELLRLLDCRYRKEEDS